MVVQAGAVAARGATKAAEATGKAAAKTGAKAGAKAGKGTAKLGKKAAGKAAAAGKRSAEGIGKGGARGLRKGTRAGGLGRPRRLRGRLLRGAGRAAGKAGKDTAGRLPGGAAPRGRPSGRLGKAAKKGAEKGAQAARRAPGAAARAGGSAQHGARRGAGTAGRAGRAAGEAARGDNAGSAQSGAPVSPDRAATAAAGAAVAVGGAAARYGTRIARRTVRVAGRMVPLPIKALLIGLLVTILLITGLATAASEILDEGADFHQVLDGLGGGTLEGEALAVRIADHTEIPLDAARAYVAGAEAYDGVEWDLLAGVGKLECDHGRSQLAGCNPPGTINHAGARGPLQFLGSTWRHSAGTFDLDVSGPPVDDGRGYATDGSGNGIADPWDWLDAGHAAARYLQDHGAADDPARAAFAYFNGGGARFDPNHFYHRGVLRYAEQYRNEVPAGPGRPGRPGDLTCPPGVSPIGGTERVAEPGRITDATQFMLDTAVPCFGRINGIGCFDPRDGSGRRTPVLGLGGSGEHPRGRACDIMVACGGCTPDTERRAQGEELAHWLRANADELNVAYVIWYRQIWSKARDSEGWRPYTGPSPHIDHVHVTLSLQPGDPAWARCGGLAGCTD